MTQEGEFTIDISAKANTKPVFYGKAPNSSLQDYALAAATYEDAVGHLKQTYFKNTTKIVVPKGYEIEDILVIDEAGYGLDRPIAEEEVRIKFE